MASARGIPGGEADKEMYISAQVALYPLVGSEGAVSVNSFVERLRAEGLDCEVHSMSTEVWGEDTRVFEALNLAYSEACSRGPVILDVTLSNACPRLPTRGQGRSEHHQ